MKNALFFIRSVLRTKECDEVFFVNVIKLLLCALSRKPFAQDIQNKVSIILENFLQEISYRLSSSREFSVNTWHMQKEIKVHNVCKYVCTYSYTYIHIHIYMSSSESRRQEEASSAHIHAYMTDTVSYLHR